MSIQKGFFLVYFNCSVYSRYEYSVIYEALVTEICKNVKNIPELALWMLFLKKCFYLIKILNLLLHFAWGYVYYKVLYFEVDKVNALVLDDPNWSTDMERLRLAGIESFPLSNTDITYCQSFPKEIGKLPCGPQYCSNFNLT